MFNIPRQGNPKEHLLDEHLIYSHEYLTEQRRVLFLRGPMMGLPMRTDSYAPAGVADDIYAINIHDTRNPTYTEIKPIYIIIDSPGGDISSGIQLYDIIKSSRAPVITIGQSCSSMAASILAAGTERLLFPNSSVMMHLIQAQFEGNVEQLKIRSEMLQRRKEDMVSLLISDGATAAIKTKDGKPPLASKIRKKLLEDIDQEIWLDSKSAIDYGIADRLVTQEDLFGG